VPTPSSLRGGEVHLRCPAGSIEFSLAMTPLAPEGTPCRSTLRRSQEVHGDRSFPACSRTRWLQAMPILHEAAARCAARSLAMEPA
jgi:hypothetical protein